MHTHRAMRHLLVVLGLILTLPAEAALTKGQLRAWLEEALVAAQKVPPDERRELAYSLDLNGRTTAAVRGSLFKIALRPSGNGWSDLWRNVPEAERALVLEFLEAEYRARAGVESEERRQWQSGLAEMLFTIGRFDEGLALMRQVVAVGGATPYQQILLAVMEHVGGNPEPFRRLAARPPKAPEPGYDTGTSYLQAIVQSIGQRMLWILPREKVPPQIPQMMTGSTNWVDRMHGLRILSRTRPAEGERELIKVLIDPSTPVWAKDDALFALVQLPKLFDTNPTRVIEALDCWRRSRGVVIPFATAETWARLRALPQSDESKEWVDAESRACYRAGPDDDPPSHECLLTAAAMYMLAATNENDFDTARHAMEWAASLALRDGRGLRNIAAHLAIVGLNQHPSEQVMQVVRYAATLPVPLLPELKEQVAAAVRAQTGPAPAAPWTRRPSVRAAARCP